MTVSRFGTMVGALVWRQSDGRYLLLQRSAQKDFAAGQWECVTGRIEQSESFSAAVRREALEALGQAVQVACIVGTTHFYRGGVGPAQEMVGVHYGCSVGAGQEIRLSQEHTACQWVTSHEAEGLFPVGHWLRELIGRAEVMRRLLPEELRQFHRAQGFEI
jgi:8-oxo-dGTP pyrophosphatase MutT (NUDIX family)